MSFNRSGYGGEPNPHKCSLNVQAGKGGHKRPVTNSLASDTNVYTLQADFVTAQTGKKTGNVVSDGPKGSTVGPSDGAGAHAWQPAPLARTSAPSLGIYSHILTDGRRMDRDNVLWKVYPRGSQSIAPAIVGAKKARDKTPKRGTIKGASKKSMARLRGQLVKLDCKHAYAVTLTVPGPEIAPPQWRRLWNTYNKRIERLGLNMLWRVELQKRHQPHIHGIVWHPSGGLPPGVTHDAVMTGIRLAWWKVLETLGPCSWKSDRAEHWCSNRMAVNGAVDHAVDVQAESRDSRSGWWRYVASHASKNKQAQGGWCGRQWGMIGRAKIQEAPAMSFELTFRQHSYVVRRMMRLMRTSHHFGNRGTVSWFARVSTVTAIIEMAIKYIDAKPLMM